MAHKKLNLETKMCVHCAKPMEWRKAWRNCWETVKYCSNACQRQANREARQIAHRTEPEPDPTEKLPPSLKTQRFRRQRRTLALPTR